jgi:hypothetical protein
MKLLFSVAVALTMTTGSVMAQQKGSGWATAPESNGWFLLRSKVVQNDLGLSDEVASKLGSLRADSEAALDNDFQDAGLNPRNFGSMTAEQRVKFGDIRKKNSDEFGQKGKELLSADQNKRLQQLQFQYRLRQNSEMALRLPDVAAELKLTDEQARKLRAIGGEFARAIPSFEGTSFQGHRDEYNVKAIDVLTAEQKETLNKLQGNEIDLSFFFPRTIQRKRN